MTRRVLRATINLLYKERLITVATTVTDRQTQQFCYSPPTIFSGKTDLRFGLCGSKHIEKQCFQVVPTPFWNGQNFD